MPIYEYRCRACDRQTEVMQRISDPPLSTCEACGGELKKLISAPAFQFKGSGWYVTDYARKSNGKGDGKSEETKSSSEGAGTSSTESTGGKETTGGKESTTSAAKGSGTAKNGSTTKSSSSS